MIWVLIAVAGVIAWVSLVALFVAQCAMAGQADRRMEGARIRDADVIKLPVRSYFRSRESRRSFSSLPSVWHVGQ